MKLHLIKSEELINEIVDRCSDQLHDPEPQFDGVLSFMTREEIDELMAVLLETFNIQKQRAKLAHR